MSAAQGSSSSGPSGFTPSGPFQFAPPFAFSGKREDFEELSFKFRAYMNLMNPSFSKVFKLIEEHLETEITGAAFTDVNGQTDQEMVALAHTPFSAP